MGVKTGDWYMKRLTKQQAEIVKQGLYDALDDLVYKHPDYLPNAFGEIWINNNQKNAYLRRMADKGMIYAKYHERGWYRWYTYKRKGLSAKEEKT